jgi:glycosyltransferase involved in cell wall biosynthesis
VVTPTYNNAGTLAAVLDGIERLGLPTIAVDDGSTDGTAAILAGRAARRSGPALRVIRHPMNLGKAAALRTGFAAADAAGFSHAVTIDTDGQLDPADIPRLLEQARRRPRALVLGARTDEGAGRPARGIVGRLFSKSMIALECGVSLADSQCGLRVYPLELPRTVACRAGRFGYETEIITRGVWAGFECVQVPVSCRYFPPDRRVSHYRPWRDTFFLVLLHVRLTLTRVLFHDHSRAGFPAPSGSAATAAATPPGTPRSRSP